MKNIYKHFKLLVINLTFILPALVLTSCKKDIPICKNVSQKSEKTSVQLNESIYNKVFGNKSCSPRQLDLRLPVNSSNDNLDKKSNNEAHTPIVTTFITFSNKDQNFSISRLDKKNNKWFYTEGNSCLAWKWSGNDNNQNLVLSMERNLQIRDSNIKNIIFIVSLPQEIKEARGVKVNLKRYTWDRTTSSLGRLHNFAKQNYPEILSMLRERERGNFSGNAFISGEEVIKDIAIDLEKIGKDGGVYLVKELTAIKATEDKATYQFTQESPACEVPNDLKV